jgi:hypothetical protein
MADPNIGVTAVSYQFLPWVRRGLTVALSEVDTLGAGLPSRAVAQVGVKLAAPLDATPIEPLAVRLHGPGDVIGIDTRLVVRTDPRPDAQNFEPNYLAIVDFDPPDFPWMLTPARANADDRLRPWLVLVVLEVAKTGLPRLQPQALLPSVRIPAAAVASELPDLAESWSWAHAQLISKATDGAGLQADLQGQPASNVSRLVCPRRLKPSTAYVACVVPAFEPGRLRGLGLADDAAPAMQQLAPAWTPQAAGDVVLPVYYHWQFSTSVAGDFESLARRLKTPSRYKDDPAMMARLEAVGTAPLGVDELLGASDPPRLETMEGALVPVKYPPGAAPQAVHAASLSTLVNTPQERLVNPVGDLGVDAAGARLEVKPPLYGAWHVKQHQVQPAELGARWLADLNLAPRYRGAAGYGAEVVRRHQEDYVDAAWDQIGDILAAERRFNLTRLAIEAQLALRRKHFDKLPPARLLQLMGPALPRIEAVGGDDVAYRIGHDVGSLGGQIERSSLPAALTDGALRRLASPQRRALRMAARLNGQARLGTLATRYVGAMAQASTRSAAFAVNAFIPDGIVGSRVLEGVNLNQAQDVRIDLTALGFGRPSVGRLKQALDGGTAAQRQLEQVGVPALKIRVGQHAGVFTDAHVERFGQLASAAPGVSGADWGVVAKTVESLGRRGIEGFLVQAQRDTATLQFNAVRLDARSGQLRLERALARFDASRRAIAPLPLRRGARPVLALGGLGLGAVDVGSARRFDTAALLNALPPNALQDAPAAPGAGRFVLDPGFRFNAPPAPPEPPASVTLTLPPAIRRREVLNRYAEATRGTQQLWRDAFEASRVAVKPVDFGIAAAAATIRLRTDPRQTLPARLRSIVSIGGSGAARDNFFVGKYLAAGDLAGEQRYMIPALFDRVMAWPKLPEPLYAALAGFDKNAFMPGVDDIPQDLIMLVKVNQHFVDAFMVGANEEMNRELLWRGFPTDLRGTPFQRFWGRERIVPPALRVLLDDMLPIHRWGAQPLGRRVDPVGGDPNRVALLLRGQLLRRYPNTAVYAWRRRAQPSPAGQTQLDKQPDGSAAAGAIQTPVFSGVIGDDITFFGFDIDDVDIGLWCFVLEEQMSEPRFGFDVDAPAAPPTIGPKARPALRAQLERLAALTPPQLAASSYNAYKALGWGHVGVAEGGFASVRALAEVPNKPFASFPTLTATPTAAEIAKALLQQPFRAYYVGDDLVP